ncbi:MAG: penicillin-binding protein 2 [Bacteroidota bacterium]
MLDNRKYIIQLAVLLIVAVYSFRLYRLQVADEVYAERSEAKTTIKVIEHPQRGLIYDRKGNLIINNIPVFNVNVVANDLYIPDTTLLCSLLDLTQEELEAKLKEARGGIRRYQPFLLKKQLTLRQHARLQGHLADFEGLFVESSTIREYPFACFDKGVGYVKEVDARILERDTTDYYQRGDLIGRSGLERSYEAELRGVRGVKQYIRSARGVKKNELPNDNQGQKAIVGQDLISSIDIYLQQYGEQLMQNKRGSVVAIEPKTGEILAMISAPTYDPNLLTGSGKEVSKNFQQLLSDPDKPLFNRATMAAEPPGSTFKLVQSLIGLQEGVLVPEVTRFSCTRDIVNCHNHPSPLDVHGAIQHSCNPFYLKAFRRIINQGRAEDEREDTRIGLTKWNEYMHSFGLGERLGIDLTEKSGLIPSVEYYDRKYSRYPNSWRLSNIYSLSIGQGEVSLTPLQMANLAATIANRGYYLKPHLIKKIGDEDLLPLEFRERHYTMVDKKHFDLVADAMVDVVRAGTARRAITPNIEVCGKTGTVQNPHGEDHSAFIAFAPKDDPKIAIAVYVENSGFGGTWAAPIASLMIEKYLTDSVTQTYKEKRILEADLITPKPKKPQKAVVTVSEKPKSTPKLEEEESR